MKLLKKSRKKIWIIYNLKKPKKSRIYRKKIPRKIFRELHKFEKYMKKTEIYRKKIWKRSAAVSGSDAGAMENDKKYGAEINFYKF